MQSPSSSAVAAADIAAGTSPTGTRPVKGVQRARARRAGTPQSPWGPPPPHALIARASERARVSCSLFAENDRAARVRFPRTVPECVPPLGPPVLLAFPVRGTRAITLLFRSRTDGILLYTSWRARSPFLCRRSVARARHPEVYRGKNALGNGEKTPPECCIDPRKFDPKKCIKRVAASTSGGSQFLMESYSIWLCPRNCSESVTIIDSRAKLGLIGRILKFRNIVVVSLFHVYVFFNLLDRDNKNECSRER